MTYTPPFAVTASYQKSQYATGTYTQGGSQVFSHLVSPPTSGVTAETAADTDAHTAGFSAYGNANEVATVTITGSPTGGTFKLLFGGQTTSAIAYNASNTTVQSALRALSSIPINSTGTDDVQSVTITGSPTGGTFTLTFGGQTTSGIAFDASASTVQSALVALSSVGSNNVSVTGANGGPYTVTFIGALGKAPQTAMTASGASLTGGTTPGVTIGHPTTGVAPTYSVAVTGSNGGPYTVTFSGKLAAKNLQGFAGDGRSLTGGTHPAVTVTTQTQGRSAFVNDALADAHRQRDWVRDFADSAGGNHV